MNGAIYGSCNCDWGCPCNFDVAPSYGHCDGVYMFAVREGRYGEVPLDGLHFAWAAHSPGPLHEGNVTAALIVDESATPEQREAVTTLWRSGSSGLPFDILNSVTATWLETVYAPFDVELAGISTKAKIGGGEIYELALARVKNPVTGADEELYLDKPTGFTSKRSELGMSEVARFSCDGLSFDTSGKASEYAEFEYAGPG
ncbi:MAG TPA: DUF1326 domain-containing protein [Gaiellaceae bacterium]|jgi:hypothetical protein